MPANVNVPSRYRSFSIKSLSIQCNACLTTVYSVVDVYWIPIRHNISTVTLETVTAGCCASVLSPLSTSTSTMAARRQSSSTSLAKFARVNSPDLSNRSLDFCNAFWGTAEGGVDVLFARMRGAGRTVEELRAFWKERASIEEDYSKRLSKLAKQVLGRDEIGYETACDYHHALIRLTDTSAESSKTPSTPCA